MCMHVCMCVCMYVCVYACMYVMRKVNTKHDLQNARGQVTEKGKRGKRRVKQRAFVFML